MSLVLEFLATPMGAINSKNALTDHTCQGIFYIQFIFLLKLPVLLLTERWVL